MDNKANTFGVWIDRETHQNTFQTLSSSEGGVFSITEKLIKNSSSYQHSQKAVISGFYYEEKDSFLASDTKVYPTNWLSISLFRIQKLALL